MKMYYMIDMPDIFEIHFILYESNNRTWENKRIQTTSLITNMNFTIPKFIPLPNFIFFFV